MNRLVVPVNRISRAGLDLDEYDGADPLDLPSEEETSQLLRKVHDTSRARAGTIQG